MGVYIKGMDMPKTCEECCLESFCNLWIEAIKMSGVELKVGAKATIRHPDCPLVFVSERGRSIDAEESKSFISIYTGNCKNYSNGTCVLEGGEVVPCLGVCGCYCPKEEIE